MELTLRLLNRVFEHQPQLVSRLHGPTQPLLQHLAKRTHDALRQTEKLHTDYHLELTEAIQTLLQRLWQSGAAPLARELGVPKTFGV
ncbi:hypothetical protein [Hymenobacter cellulosilyticus]|uniref:Uncharacterized protein n=1 Tax=Hymenobacter cellulosilyticus TaxID=2932248 RepID=A0A8T9QBE6_9BACT|nr:hypothetical protein [Hymenobacter cellulosilyticus]UOQ74827.1 hypothetical protein MUN79_13715 [Hymenobacter cellulosilyticus]